MSVLIKGMGKPKNCYDCPLHYGHADCSYAEVRKHGSVLETICPMVELPDHGDLIDRDELSDAMYHEAFETDSKMQKWDSGCWIRYKMFEKKRDNAPVVIPAERGEDERE